MNSNKKEQNHVSLRLPKEQLDTLVKLANADDRSVSAIIRISISDYIKKTPQPVQ